MKKPRKKILVNSRLQYRQALTSVITLVVTINLFVLAGTFFPIETGLYVNFSISQFLFTAFIEITLISIVWYWSIKSSHKVAGPAIAFGRELEKLAMGDLTVQVNLRPGDAFQETAEKINIGVTNLRLRVETVKRIANELQRGDVQNMQSQILRLNAELEKIITNNHLKNS